MIKLYSVTNTCPDIAKSYKNFLKIGKLKYRKPLKGSPKCLYKER
jgi:hypothetical protein